MSLIDQLVGAVATLRLAFHAFPDHVFKSTRLRRSQARAGSTREVSYPLSAANRLQTDSSAAKTYLAEDFSVARWPER
jgi:hypothetical protein